MYIVYWTTEVSVKRKKRKDWDLRHDHDSVVNSNC